MSRHRTARDARERSRRRCGLVPDLADDRGFLRDDLVRDLAAMDLDLAREVERDAYAVALDARDADYADGVVRIADDDLFTLASCDDQHSAPPAIRSDRSWSGRYNPLIKGKHTYAIRSPGHTIVPHPFQKARILLSQLGYPSHPDFGPFRGNQLHDGAGSLRGERGSKAAVNPHGSASGSESSQAST